MATKTKKSKVQGSLSQPLDKNQMPPTAPFVRVIQSIDPRTGLLLKKPRVIQKGQKAK